MTSRGHTFWAWPFLRPLWPAQLGNKSPRELAFWGSGSDHFNTALCCCLEATEGEEVLHDTVVREQSVCVTSTVAGRRVQLCNRAEETNRDIKGPLIQHMEICNVAARPLGVRCVLPREPPSSARELQLQPLVPGDSSPHLPGGQLRGRQTAHPRCLFMLLGKIHVNSDLLVLSACPSIPCRERVFDLRRCALPLPWGFAGIHPG